MAFLQLNNVCKNYGDLDVVKNISLEVEQGEFISLLGPSGCGKTTTLHMIAGFSVVSQGSIFLNGKDITFTKPNQRGLGVVFQTYALFPHMTVQKNVLFGLEMQKVPKAQREQRVNSILKLVKLEKYADRFPKELSGGQRQRVALARALVIEPAVLLLDEPLSNLDAKLREEMQFELRRIQQQLGTTTIMVTHDQSEALSVSDRVVVMNEGQAVQVAKPYELYEKPQSQFIGNFVGKTNQFKTRIQQDDRGSSIHIGSVTCQINSTIKNHSDIIVSLRPEKISITSPSSQSKLNGTIKVSFFMGAHWLYEVSTEAGDITVLVPNNGATHHDIGTLVGLSWHDQALHALPL